MRACSFATVGTRRTKQKGIRMGKKSSKKKSDKKKDKKDKKKKGKKKK